VRILFLNQYFPPDPAPTGVLLHEVAQALAAKGHSVEFVAARQDYRASQHQGSRMMRELKALWTMLIDGVSRRRADLVISATSPPCLLIVATLVAAWHRARSIHWSMDLYPQIAVATGVARPGWIVSAIEWMMGRCYRSCAHVVALDSDMVEQFHRYGVTPEIIQPWVFQPVLEAPVNEIEPQEPWVWVYSGNLGRAHEWEALLQAQALIEERRSDIRLLFQGGGPLWPAAQARAKELGLKQCDWKPYVPLNELRASLLSCQCCVVSQAPVFRGLLWPSKLGLVLSLPRPVLWVGPTNGSIARKLNLLPHAGVFAPDQALKISDWIQELRDQVYPVAAAQTFDAGAHREASIESWCSLVTEGRAQLHNNLQPC